MTVSTAKITFIGAGNMASAIFGGLISKGYPADHITATSPEPDVLKALSDQYGIQVTSDNRAGIVNADVIVLAVKPQILEQVCSGIRSVFNDSDQFPLVISIAAGIPIASLERWLNSQLPIIRAMPNTPAMVGCGATALFANHNVSQHQRKLAEHVHGGTGITEWLSDEALMNAATAVAGSAPAYFFLLFAAMEEAAVAQGLPRDTARRLALQTGLGAATMALHCDVEPEQLMRNVMSPQGSTERAIACFESLDFRQMVNQAMTACADRALEMQTEFGGAR
ncbi:pyrroline-5-carboxylate reductase [Photobacterium sp. SP02]|uniref:pyrroline-5-carboxylate reductase n=1 Tax=Photobacterium sp. SP02 TaxID=3032280 RepID=UPI003144D373